jgi:hypothetical protein
VLAYLFIAVPALIIYGVFRVLRQFKSGSVSHHENSQKQQYPRPAIYLLLAVLMIGSGMAIWWLAQPTPIEAQTQTEKIHCELDFTRAQQPSAVTNDEIALWGHDYHILTPVQFMQKYSTDLYDRMVAGGLACRNKKVWDWTTDKAETAVTADVP